MFTVPHTKTLLKPTKFRQRNIVHVSRLQTAFSLHSTHSQRIPEFHLKRSSPWSRPCCLLFYFLHLFGLAAQLSSRNVSIKRTRGLAKAIVSSKVFQIKRLISMLYVLGIVSLERSLGDENTKAEEDTATPWELSSILLNSLLLQFLSFKCVSNLISVFIFVQVFGLAA